MRVNPKLLNQEGFFGDISLPNCPTSFRQVAERMMEMLTTPGYKMPDYNSVTELDKQLFIDYWVFSDGLTRHLKDLATFKGWFFYTATPPEWLRRARQWLVEYQYLYLKPDVAENALKAGSSVRASIKGRG